MGGVVLFALEDRLALLGWRDRDRALGSRAAASATELAVVASGMVLLVPVSVERLVRSECILIWHLVEAVGVVAGLERADDGAVGVELLDVDDVRRAGAQPED